MRLSSILLLGALLACIEPAGAQTIDGNRFGEASSNIIHQMTYGTRRRADGQTATQLPQPVPPVTPPCINPPIIVRPPIVVGGGYGGWPGYGFGYGSGYGYGYSSGNLDYYYGYANSPYSPYSPYGDNGYAGSLERENAELRRQLEMQRARRDARPQGEPPVEANPPLRGQRERVENLRAESMLRHGIRLFQKGSYAQAAQRFQLAVNLMPDNDFAVFYLAQAQFASGRFSKAVDAIKRGLSENPRWPEAQVDLRTLYTDMADLTQQIADLAKRLKDRPMDAEAMYLLAFELFATGEEDRARTLFEQTARLSADDRHIVPFLNYYKRRDEAEKDAPIEAQSKPANVPIPDLLAGPVNKDP
jgi:tetratricopeptide (TPR) repeat protein